MPPGHLFETEPHLRAFQYLSSLRSSPCFSFTEYRNRVPLQSYSRDLQPNQNGYFANWAEVEIRSESYSNLNTVLIKPGKPLDQSHISNLLHESYTAKIQ